jgi:hypothetical protein
MKEWNLGWSMKKMWDMQVGREVSGKGERTQNKEWSSSLTGAQVWLGTDKLVPSWERPFIG